MANELQGLHVAFLATDGVEQVELQQPWEALEQAGAHVELISLKGGRIRANDHLDPADHFDVDRKVSDADPADYDALVLPGGVANPDFLRVDADVKRFVHGFFEAGKPVAAICHGPWTLIDAGVVAGRSLTSWPSLETDLRNAGAHWVDEETHLDGQLLTSRKPADLPAFVEAMTELFSRALGEAAGRGVARRPGQRVRGDIVDETVEESFPASDPPAGPSSI